MKTESKTNFKICSRLINSALDAFLYYVIIKKQCRKNYNLDTTGAHKFPVSNGVRAV
ncbi:hypothetical protein [Aestuariibaculum sediminum]|uniref:Uncharacterized protein n=1 Tax=Aestuariibaculum sediminum TaxID=2770637 RepID=A0A8J6Q0F6_9FLAO|nr:hypothetical protein [Aestuariibaculum sediminum]MBD0832462.1 hypothetical protein [Aestuariibaculum sediminum]